MTEAVCYRHAILTESRHGRPIRTKSTQHAEDENRQRASEETGWVLYFNYFVGCAVNQAGAAVVLKSKYAIFGLFS